MLSLPHTHFFLFIPLPTTNHLTFCTYWLSSRGEETACAESKSWRGTESWESKTETFSEVCVRRSVEARAKTGWEWNSTTPPAHSQVQDKDISAEYRNCPSPLGITCFRVYFLFRASLNPVIDAGDKGLVLLLQVGDKSTGSPQFQSYPWN